MSVEISAFLQQKSPLDKPKRLKLYFIFIFAVMFSAADLIAQKPKLAPHIPAIRASVAKMLDVPAELVNISAKTAEKQGTIGGGKAIACDATVTLMKID